MKIAIRLSQKINSRIHNSRIAIRQRIAQLGIMFAVIFDDGYTNRNIFYFYRRVGYSPNQVKNTTKFYFNIIMWLKLVTSDSRFVSVGN